MALRRHEGKVTVFVPHYAMSGGTLLCLAADEVAMDENAVLGPVDPRIGEYPAASILRVPRLKPPEEIEDETFISTSGKETPGFNRGGIARIKPRTLSPRGSYRIDR